MNMKTAAWCVVCCFVISAGVFASVDSTGIKFLNAGKTKQAQAFFESAVKQNPRDAESYSLLAMSLLRQGKFDEAADAIDAALDIDDHVSNYHYIRGAVLGEKAMRANVFSQGLLAPKIKKEFKRAVELDSKNIDGHIGLYNYYIQAPGFMGGSEEKALEEAKIILSLDAFRGHQFLATYYLKMTDSASAEAEYKKAIAADPKKPNGYYQYGMFLGNKKKEDQAYAQFQKIIDLDPKGSDAYYTYGRAMYNLERYDKAIEKFQYTLYLEKNHPSAIWMLANCYEKKGMKVKAIETYQWYLQADPNGRRAEMAQQKLKDLH
jgi:tetratricopeptide (TPR) repeat protein